MRVLFAVRDAFYLRNFESLLRTLVARGHEVHVAFEQPPKAPFRRGLVEVLTEELEGFSTSLVPKRRSRRWHRTSDRLRRSLDYLRYLDPLYDATPSFRARTRRLAPPSVRRLLDLRALRAPRVRRALTALLSQAEQAIPTSRTLVEFLRGSRPDVVVVSPLVHLGSRQADVLRAARRIGVPTCFCAYSWDNLTTKGTVRGDPDLVAVWNEPQRREAIELHALEPARVRTLGATAYDHWFGWRPSTTREDFCAATGLRPDRPYVLYVGSALITGREGPFIEEWVRALRDSGHPALREAGVLVRPHPQRPPTPEELDLSGEDGATVWPAPGVSTLGVEGRATLFDSIFHATAVVGLNTSGFIDAAIIGRPSYAILPPQFCDSQAETLHFRYLLEAGGGLLTVAGTFEEHAAQLATALEGAEPPVPRERFVEAFVRPGGVEVAVTDALAAAIEAQAADGPRPAPRRRLARAAGLALALLLSEAFRWAEPRCRAQLRRRAARPLRRTAKRGRRVLKARWSAAAPRRSGVPSGPRDGRGRRPRRS